jgi:hypothetical protein
MVAMFYGFSSIRRTLLKVADITVEVRLSQKQDSKVKAFADVTIPLTFIDLWNEKAGFARIWAFDSKRGAAYYCAKYIAKQINDWDLSDNLRAFGNYQPVLPLEGGSKPPILKTQPNNDEIGTRVRPNQSQMPMRYLLEGIQTPKERDISAVYKSEVTRGRGKFRDFGFGG